MYRPLCTSKDVTLFQEDVTTLNTALNEKHLTFQPTKCKQMLFSYGNVPPRFPVNITLGNTTLEIVQTAKLLGVLFDSKLSFVPHYRMAITKAKRAIGTVNRKFCKSDPPHVFRHVFTSCILPALMYAIEIWLPAAQYCRENIEKVQRHMARIVQNDYRSPYLQLIQAVHWLPLWRRILIIQLGLFFKYYHGYRFVPRYVFPAPHRQNLRAIEAGVTHVSNVYLPSHTNATGNQFFYATSKIWNSLPGQYVNHIRFSNFKRYIRSQALVDRLTDRNLLPNTNIR